MLARMLQSVVCRTLPISIPLLMVCFSACSGARDESDTTTREALQRAQDDLPFASAIFRATHNSYSGNVDGAKGPILTQLSNGVRFIELDLHDTNYDTVGDFTIGHNSPGDAVDHAGGNPASNSLRDWLVPIAQWSSQNPDHAPLLVMFDLKDNLTNNDSFAAGDFFALDAEVQSVFGGQRLLAKNATSSLPTIGASRGKVLTLLSGDGTARTGYKLDEGHHPAVAMNAHGQVVEVHDSGAGWLWYWTGTLGTDGHVIWRRHGRYDTGQTPAVALNDNGWLVEVHQSQAAGTLWYHVGHLGADGEITWSDSHEYDNGILPTVQFVDAAGTTLREIHRSQAHDQNWDWHGVLDTSARTVGWNASTHGKTSDARYDSTVASSGPSNVHVWTGADGNAPSDTLLYGTNRVVSERIRYPQWAFVEYQPGDSAELQSGAWFYAAPSTNSDFIVSARQNGRVVRGWDFDNASLATNPLANYPATNFPYSDWYGALMDQAVPVE